MYQIALLFITIRSIHDGVCLFAADLCADCDCAVWGQALQLCPSQYGAMAVVPLRGSWRAAVGSGRRVRDKEQIRRMTIKYCVTEGVEYFIKFNILQYSHRYDIFFP